MVRCMYSVCIDQVVSCTVLQYRTFFYLSGTSIHNVNVCLWRFPQLVAYAVTRIVMSPLRGRRTTPYVESVHLGSNINSYYGAAVKEGMTINGKDAQYSCFCVRVHSMYSRYHLRWNTSLHKLSVARWEWMNVCVCVRLQRHDSELY